MVRRWGAPVVLGVTGIIAVSLGLRTGVTSLSPLAPLVTGDIPLSSLHLGFLAATPALMFAASGLFAPAMIRRLGVDRVMLVVLAVSALSHLARSIAGGFGLLLAATVVLMLAVGVGNITLPVAVKIYAPNNVGLLTSAYATGLALSTAVGAWAALVIAGDWGWRVSLGFWGIISAVAMVPWVVLVARSPRGLSSAVTPHPLPVMGWRLFRSPTAWAVLATFALPSVTAYTMFGLLPVIGIDHLGRGPADAAALLTIFAAVGIPLAAIVPRLAHRPLVTGSLVVGAGALLIVGYLGLAFIVTIPVVWVAALALATLMFSLSLALIGLRSDTVSTATELSGFVNGFGYFVAALGPMIVGVVVAAQDTWTYALAAMSVTGFLVIPAGLILFRGRSVDSELS